MERSREQKLEDLKTVVIYSTLGVGTAVGAFLVGRHLIRTVVANISQRHSLEEGDPATFAKQLKMAFENDNYLGWGTNTKAVYKAFQEIPSKRMYSKVQKEYQRMYNKSLNADLEDELTSDEYNAIIRILNTKT